MKKTYIATVTNGKLNLESPDSFKNAIKGLEGKQIKITISLNRQIRSTNANSLYWKWMTILGDFMGYSKEEVHFLFKKLFLADRMPVLSRDVFMAYLQAQEGILSTTKLNSKEMSVYMEKIREQAKELDCRLPLPDDVIYEDM